MTYETITLTKEDGIATVTLNRPQRLNAWTPRMGAELTHAFRDADRDAAVRAIIFTGAGRAFCAGADMDFFAQQIAAGYRSADHAEAVRAFKEKRAPAFRGR